MWEINMWWRIISLIAINYRSLSFESSQCGKLSILLSPQNWNNCRLGMELKIGWEQIGTSTMHEVPPLMVRWGGIHLFKLALIYTLKLNLAERWTPNKHQLEFSLAWKSKQVWTNVFLFILPWISNCPSKKFFSSCLFSPRLIIPSSIAIFSRLI